MVTQEDLYSALCIEVSKWTEPEMVMDEPDCRSAFEDKRELDVPDVVCSPAAINTGWCRVFAERVMERLGLPSEVSITSDGETHTWLEFEGLCYDAECLKGVSHPTLLPVYNSL